MQGRLSPKLQGRYQAHPVGYWQQEFIVAKQLGLDCIEFILDYYAAKENPLLKDGGIDEIKLLTEKTQVFVKTICADYFMEKPLHSRDKLTARKSTEVLVKLLNIASQLGISLH